MKKISAEIIADSISPQGHRITSFILTYPRFIHSELMTYRVFSRNSASSRAIPFEKMVKMVEEDPFIPIAWQKDHKGMQGNEYITNAEDIEYRIHLWLKARNNAVRGAKDLSDNQAYPHGTYDPKIKEGGVTKQLCNRLLEPFMWHTVLLTGTEFENFFELRCPQYKGSFSENVYKSRKEAILSPYGEFSNFGELDWLNANKGQAEIHIMDLAEKIYDAMNESTPKELKEGEYHIPFGDKISDGELRDYFYNVENNPDPSFTAYQEAKLKISTARCARLSYMNFDGEINYKKDIKLHDQLIGPPFHASPFEHCARAMSDKEYANFSKTSLSNLDNRVIDIGWCNNFKGFIQYRYLIENNYE